MRIRLFTLVTGAALLGIGGLALSLLRSRTGSGDDSAESAPPDAGDARSRLASRLRPRALPKFQTVETPQAPAPVPPPSFVKPPPLAPPPQSPPAEASELKQRASRDGFAYREAGSNAVFVVQNGTKFWVKSAEELRALGYSWDKVEVVQPNSLNFLRDHPPEKTLLRERDNPAVFYYENGQKHWITSADKFEKLGHKWTDVKVVPSGSLGSEATGSPIQ